MLLMNLGARKLVNEPPGREGKCILEHLPPPLRVRGSWWSTQKNAVVLYSYYKDSFVAKLLSYNASASFKIKFTHNCSCYNGNLLHLKCLLFRTSLLMRVKWEFGCTDQVGLDLRKIEGKYTHIPWKPPRSKSIPHKGSVAWKAVLVFYSGAFLTGAQVCAALTREKGKL